MAIATELPRSQLPATGDVLVIGGGAIGVSILYALAQRGVSAVLVERGRIGMGASAGTACMVTPSHSDRLASPASFREGARHVFDREAPLSLRIRPGSLPWLARFTAASVRGAAADAGTAHLRELARRSLELHRRWSTSAGTGLVEQGTLTVWCGERALEQRAALVAEQRAAGFTITELSGEEVQALEPLVLDAACGALCSDDGHVDSLLFTQRVAAAARSAGAVVCEETDVIQIDRTGGRLRVATTRGEIRCSQIVLSAGVWARRFCDDLGVDLPLTPAKGYNVEFAGLGARASRPIYLADEHVVATPVGDRLRLAGTLEIGTDPEFVDQRRIDAVRRAGERHLAGVAAATPSGVWKGLRPLSVDGMPIIGPIPRDPRVCVAVGHAMLGITLAPITGELVADHVTGVSRAIDPLLDPARFRRGLRFR